MTSLPSLGSCIIPRILTSSCYILAMRWILFALCCPWHAGSPWTQNKEITQWQLKLLISWVDMIHLSLVRRFVSGISIVMETWLMETPFFPWWLWFPRKFQKNKQTVVSACVQMSFDFMISSSVLCASIYPLKTKELCEL